MDKRLPNATIAGAGTIGCGEYDKVGCSGSVKITGDIRCVSMSCSGAVKAIGNIICEKMFKISGVFKSEGGCKADAVLSSGSMRFEKSLETRDLSISGTFHCGENCSAETAKIRGAVCITGLLNAETADICLDEHNGRGGNKIGSIGGGTVIIKFRNSMMRRYLKFLCKPKKKIFVTEIEADSVSLEHTVVNIVRTVDAVIGEGCEIETLEYSGMLSINEKATVKHLVRV